MPPFSGSLAMKWNRELFGGSLRQSKSNAVPLTSNLWLGTLRRALSSVEILKNFPGKQLLKRVKEPRINPRYKTSESVCRACRQIDLQCSWVRENASCCEHDSRFYRVLGLLLLCLSLLGLFYPISYLRIVSQRWKEGANPFGITEGLDWEHSSFIIIITK